MPVATSPSTPIQPGAAAVCVSAMPLSVVQAPVSAYEFVLDRFLSGLRLPG